MKNSKVKLLQRIMIGVFLLAIAIGCYIIFTLASSSKDEWVKNTTVHSKVVEIYNGDKGKPNYKIMVLADSQRFAIPEKMLGKLQIGDSVQKEKDSSYYIFTLQSSGEKIKAGKQ